MTNGISLDDNSVQASRAVRILQHIPYDDSVAVVREMKRVTAPGGKVVLVDPDWMGLKIGVIDHLVERTLADDSFSHVNNPEIALRSAMIMSDLGLVPVEREVVTRNFTSFDFFNKIYQITDRLEKLRLKGSLSQDQVVNYLDKARNLSASGGFFATVGIYVTSGTKS